MAKTTIKDIVDLWYETQMGHYLKCIEKQHKFQDLISNSPLSSRSVGKGGEVMQDRVNALNDAKNPNKSHCTAQGTKNKDYMPIHKLIALYKLSMDCLTVNGLRNLASSNTLSKTVKAITLALRFSIMPSAIRSKAFWFTFTYDIFCVSFFVLTIQYF